VQQQNPRKQKLSIPLPVDDALRAALNTPPAPPKPQPKKKAAKKAAKKPKK